MQLDSALKKTAVLGASGKMGKGIALLLLQEIAKGVAKNRSLKESSTLVLIDSEKDSFVMLKRYLKEQILKYAEKNINALREIYLDQQELVSNKEMIDTFVLGAMDTLVITDSLRAASYSSLVFEAIVENADIKGEVLSNLKKMQKAPCYFFTNTSSIPIHLLEKLSGLNGSLLGFHFYNPPALQKLVEVVIPKDCNPELVTIGYELIKRLNKIAVIANDSPGFIGNGYLMQEIIFSCEKARELSAIYTMAKSVYLIDTVTREWLLRPMGIFQLMDYVGIDVIARILNIMGTYLPDKKLHDEWIDSMVLSGYTGGQAADGTLKRGFFAYKNDKIEAIYDMEQKDYIPLDAIIGCKKMLGKEPLLHFKTLLNDPEKSKKIVSYLKELKSGTSFGNELAKEFLTCSLEISKELLKLEVATKKEDVDQVLKSGFHHLYGAFESEAF